MYKSAFHKYNIIRSCYQTGMICRTKDGNYSFPPNPSITPWLRNTTTNNLVINYHGKYMFMYQYYVILIRYKIGGRIRNSLKEGFRVVLSSIHVSCGVKHGLKTIGRAPLVGRDSSSLGFELYWVKRNKKHSEKQ